jgi:nucleotide-binding universal stress UspA family protein
VLPHDGTPATAAALAPAADLAQRAGAELHVVHIATTAASASPGTLKAPRYLDQPQHEWGAWAREFLERMSALGGGTSLRLHLSLSAGEPGEEITRFAREHHADLIVVASSGHWEPARAAALRAVIERSATPMLVVRTGAQPAEPKEPS